MVLHETERKCLEWIDLPLDKEIWQAFVNTVMNI
jgi:hypothetical protein